jgi:hypothetical protein
MTSKAQILVVTVCAMLSAPTVFAQSVGTNNLDRFTVTLLGTGSP